MDNSALILYANSDDFQKEKSLADLLKLLPDAMQERAYRYKFAQDAYNFVLGRLLLKEGLKRMGFSEDILNNIYYNKEEKPMLEGVAFSISHSQYLVACAVSKNGQIGLDIEIPRNIKKENFRHCFNDQEWAKIMEDNTLHTFYTCWTQKEAVLKVNGVGLNRLMDMEISTQGNSVYFFDNEKNSSLFCLNSFQIEDAYACICSEKARMVQLELVMKL